jgi:serine phosphatase RsbU (regulator of sigma subunit)
VRHGRQFVEREVICRGGKVLVDDAALVAAELLANAVQHGSPPISVCVAGDSDRIRIEVRDGSARPPVRSVQSASNMTGRGLSLVAAVSARWGVDRATDGKVVWAELEPTTDVPEGGSDDVDLLLALWPGADESLPGQDRFRVVLGDVPTDLLIAAKAHIDNVVREFSLAAAGAETGNIVPPHLARLIEVVVNGFADARDAIKRQALAAARRGEVRTNLTLDLPLDAADAGEAYLAALDEADAYSRAVRLLTLATPPAHRLFRRWYVQAVVQQLRQISVGGQPEPVVPFETHLLNEVERLAVLQRITDRAARLQRVTGALAGARTPEDVAQVVVSEGVDALGASGGGLLVPAADGEHVAVPGAVGYHDELVDALREERLDSPLPAATALRTGEPVWLESQQERDLQFPTLHGFEASTVSMCAVPLIVGDRTLGALRFSFGSRRLFDADERAFVLALAAQTAQTLLRAEVYANERQASLDLQRALLPDNAPSIPGWDVATYYSPAGEEEAGGDFYDVLSLRDGHFIAVVGDVMGRGIHAAAAMAQVRTMIRAYAIADPDPVMVFNKVDRYFATIELSQLVTVLYLLVDPDGGTIHIGNAGHLPPLLVDASGSRIVPTPVGTPFGVDVGRRESTTISMDRGDSLVVITDGLVERRGEDIDVGISRILDATRGEGHWDSAGALLQLVLGGAADSGTHDDDVTVLVLCRE